MSDKLTLLGINYPALGKSLIKEAQEKEREAANAIAVASVQSILKDIVAHENAVEISRNRISLQKKRLYALERGKFEVKFDKRTGGPTLLFSEQELNGSL